MKSLILILAIYLLSGCASAAMIGEDGKVVDKDYSTKDLSTKLVKVHHDYGIADVVRHCDAKGYFIYNRTIYMCTKIRTGVTNEELQAYAKKELARIRARNAEYLRYRQGNKTDK